MKKVLLIIAGVLAAAGIAIFAFQEPIKEFAFDRITTDMFVAEDNDAFNPGLPVGATFPAVKATMDGRTITDISELSGPNGLVFVANRSVDW